MRLTVLGGGGAWPTATQACGGYLLVHHGFRLLIDPGYAVLPHLLDVLPVDRVDAVLVSHGHPDHCADLNPLLRARALSDDPPPAAAGLRAARCARRGARARPAAAVAFRRARSTISSRAVDSRSARSPWTAGPCRITYRTRGCG